MFDSAVISQLLVAMFSCLNTFLPGDLFLDTENQSSFVEYPPTDSIVCNDVLERPVLPPPRLIPILHEAFEPGGDLVLCEPTYRLPRHSEKHPSFESYSGKEAASGDPTWR